MPALNRLIHGVSASGQQWVCSVSGARRGLLQQARAPAPLLCAARPHQQAPAQPQGGLFAALQHSQQRTRAIARGATSSSSGSSGGGAGEQRCWGSTRSASSGSDSGSRAAPRRPVRCGAAADDSAAAGGSTSTVSPRLRLRARSLARSRVARRAPPLLGAPHDPLRAGAPALAHRSRPSAGTLFCCTADLHTPHNPDPGSGGGGAGVDSRCARRAANGCARRSPPHTRRAHQPAGRLAAAHRPIERLAAAAAQPALPAPRPLLSGAHLPPPPNTRAPCSVVLAVPARDGRRHGSVPGGVDHGLAGRIPGAQDGGRASALEAAAGC